MRYVSAFFCCIAAAALLTGCTRSPGIAPFDSDGCSLFPDGTWDDRTLWCDCCFEHDIAYWRGGTEGERKRADEALRDCVVEKTGNPQLAELMYHGVRLGGGSIFPSWYRWGYGWPYGRGNRPLTPNEERLVEGALAAYRAEARPYQCGD